ncbi:MAG: PEGA domain-containing protein, partial [Bacteroidales bacterium]|nr:PEGA domain-containing protein [Bacteroidales bacterium]
MVSLVKYIKYFSLLWLILVLFGQVDSYAQQLKVFSVESVEDDPFDMSANAKAATKKVDGSGDLYAILKITSDDVDDDLRAYNFDFGMLKSIVEVHDADGEIWVYVQKNAKQVTITRSGYRTVSRYDLQRTFEPGKVYRMKISVKKEVAVVGKGTLMFQITPAKAGIMVTYTNSDGVESLFGATDEYGQVAKYIELGTYTFSVVAEYYHKSEGRVKLESKNGTHTEEVVLRPNFADVELVAASGADIYVDGQKKGTSSWKGILGPGTYQVECRRENHRPTSKYVEVKDGEQYKFTLDAPVPIVGTLVLMSSPLGATVKIDNKEYGKTPLTLDNILIGSHTVTISRDKYEPQTKTIVVKEGEIIEENVALVAAKSQSSSAAVTGSKSGTINGYEYVDLGLPSGLKWATCNVGADSPEEYGDYYAWGEIETKGEYTGTNSKTYGKSMSDIS